MGAGTYRKRPLTVEAMRVDERNIAESAEWCGGEELGAGVLVPTMHGQIVARPGDWIIKARHGEFYPVLPDVFAALYDPEEADQGKGTA